MVRYGKPGLAAAALLLIGSAQGSAPSLAQGYGGYDRGAPDDGPPQRYERRDDPDDRPPPPRYDRRDDRADDDDRPRYRRPPPPDADDDRGVDRPPPRMVCVPDDDPDRRCRTRPGRPGSPCRCPGGMEGHREPLD